MSGSDPTVTYLEVTLTHPGCWTTELMAETDVGIVGHGGTVTGQTAHERCTIYGQSQTQVDLGLEIALESTRLDAAWPLEEATHRSPISGASIGQYARDVLIEYTPDHGIGPTFSTHGFVLQGTSRMEDGLERWPLLTTVDRSEIDGKLDAIRVERDVSVSLERIRSVERPNQPSSFDERRRSLTSRQREAFELARERGYYEWPRETSVTELAAELEVSKPTVLEHLRTAESRLLGERK